MRDDVTAEHAPLVVDIEWRQKHTLVLNSTKCPINAPTNCSYHHLNNCSSRFRRVAGGLLLFLHSLHRMGIQFSPFSLRKVRFPDKPYPVPVAIVIGFCVRPRFQPKNSDQAISGSGSSCYVISCESRKAVLCQLNRSYLDEAPDCLAAPLARSPRNAKAPAVGASPALFQ